MIYEFCDLCVLWQEAHAAHDEQLPPQEGCLPARFAFIIETIMQATIMIKMILTITVPMP